jgi:plastocyanin
MNTLDSRFCRDGDTFAQKFSQAGQYVYDFNLPGLNRLSKEDGRFRIEVSRGDGSKKEGRQHFVTVKQRDKMLLADPAKLQIEAGDVVLWSTSDPNTAGFSISGHSEKDSFSSAALTREALYTHAFGTPGEIEWGDAKQRRTYGKITGRMPQTNTEKDRDAFREVLKSGTLITIRDDKAEPSQVEISVGQTVFFAVEKASGISITDRRLMFDIPFEPILTADVIKVVG